VFFRLLIHSVTRRKGRKLLAAAGVWLGLTLALALLVLSLDVGDRMNRELQSFGSNIRVRPAEASLPVRVGGHEVAPPSRTAHLPEEDVHRLESIFWRNNILGVAPRLWTRARAGGSEVEVLGVPFGAPESEPGGVPPLLPGARAMYPHWKIEGSWPDSGSSGSGPGKGACLIGVDLAARLGVEPGGRMELEGDSGAANLRVSGTVSSGGREDGSVIVPLGVAQTLAGAAGKVSELDVRALTTPENRLAERYREDPDALTPEEYERWMCTPFPGSVAAAVQDALPGSSARVVRRVTETQGMVLGRIEGLVLLLASLTVAVCVLNVAGVLTSAVLERRPEMALLQAIGAHRGDVRRLFLGEAVLLGLAGGLPAAITGSWLGAALVDWIFGAPAGWHGVILILAPMLGVLIAAAGSLGPVRRALARSPALVLRGA
jgi:putative ABC transport system permease protein